MEEIPQVSAKLRGFATEAPTLDAVFLGSSRVRRQISPEVFDHEMHVSGLPMRSVNLGIDALVSPELLRFSDEVLQRTTGSVRYWIVDLNVLRRTISQDQDSPRELWWHDFKHTALVLRNIATNPVPLAENGPGKMALSLSHAALMMQHYLQIGCGAGVISRAIFPDSQITDRDAENRGFHPERHSLSVALTSTFKAQLEDMKKGQQVQFTDAIMDEIYREMSARCERENIRIFFVMMPVLSLRRPSLPPPDVLQRHTLLAFDDPAKYPELYRAEDRYDLQHFNSAGAVTFTQTLARSVAADIQSRHGKN